MEKLEMYSMEMIAASGQAKTLYLNAIGAAKEGKYKEAEDYVREADDLFESAHKVHMDLLGKFASEEDIRIDLLLVHAEAILNSTESIKTLSEQIIAIYRKLENS